MLKISPINGLNHFSVKKSEKQYNNSTNAITTSSNPTEVFTSGVPRSYINFRGKTEDELKFGDDAKQLINQAKTDLNTSMTIQIKSSRRKSTLQILSSLTHQTECTSLF